MFDFVREQHIKIARRNIGKGNGSTFVNYEKTSCIITATNAGVAAKKRKYS